MGKKEGRGGPVGKRPIRPPVYSQHWESAVSTVIVTETGKSKRGAAQERRSFNPLSLNTVQDQFSPYNYPYTGEFVCGYWGLKG